MTLFTLYLTTDSWRAGTYTMAALTLSRIADTVDRITSSLQSGRKRGQTATFFACHRRLTENVPALIPAPIRTSRLTGLPIRSSEAAVPGRPSIFYGSPYDAIRLQYSHLGGNPVDRELAGHPYYGRAVWCRRSARHIYTREKYKLVGLKRRVYTSPC